MKQEICKCCNEEKEHHLQDGSCIGCNVLGKKCKKFEAQELSLCEHSIFWKNRCPKCKPSSVCDNCGRTLENHHPNKDRSCKWKYTNYKPQNHSPEDKSLDTLKKDNSQSTSGTHSQQGKHKNCIDCGTYKPKTDTYNLSEKRKEVENLLENTALSMGERAVIMNYIKQQDKEFIQRLKKIKIRSYNYEEFCEEIDKLSGDLK